MALDTTPAGTNQRRKLVGHANFVSHNPHSDKFHVHRFHHVEFYTTDATTAYKRFQYGLGMPLVAKSDLSTGNTSCASYVLRSGELVFTITAPVLETGESPGNSCPIPEYSSASAYDFVRKHGLAVRAVGWRVGDAAAAHRISCANGAISVLEPTVLTDTTTGEQSTVSEIKAYGDVVIRMVSGTFSGPFLPNYAPVDATSTTYGLERLDHAVGNTPNLFETAEYLLKATGFHEFAEFTAEDIGTVDSGLNSMVIANNNEFVLMPINEPTFGTARKSQIQTYLEQNGGPGLQHLALKTNDIFATLRAMRSRTDSGGFEFMPRASAKYYKSLPEKVGSVLTSEQYKAAEELGILVDRDHQGVLLQIFTRPVGDRPTLFFEVIQRIGCEVPANELSTQGELDARSQDGRVKIAQVEQAGGCGGFGKGNFTELFKSIEKYEDTLTI